MTRARPRDEEWATGARPRECMHAGMHGAQRLERARGRGAGRSELCARTACGSEGGARRAFEPQGVASWGTARQSYPQERKAQPRQGGGVPHVPHGHASRGRRGGRSGGGSSSCVVTVEMPVGVSRISMSRMYTSIIVVAWCVEERTAEQASMRSILHRADGRRKSSQHSGPTGDTVVILLSM